MDDFGGKLRQARERRSDSSAVEGAVQDGGALFPDLSPDGGHIAFQSYAPLVPGDTDVRQDIFVHDAQTGETEMVSVSTRGTSAEVDARYASISEGGRYVAFASTAPLVPQDTNNASDIFVRDRLTDTTRRVTVTSSGSEAQSGNAPFTPGSHFPSISPDGRYVAYQSDAPNLTPDETKRFLARAASQPGLLREGWVPSVGW